ncbi:dihydroorotate dehydrogenase-like protein [Bosea sp. PAMC 26642]|uniref:dihydroorotate dehydrogenase-like protein n=1 Tax=Bosea sp. (strain PAMC 26642) TaxID=1792307 RepID=UPI0007703609|nr:dihydroorotate dehydrogenase-like protein [Bosea sp. PAMC 26642]AMJ59686.1 dihydroorotate dehydrogenase [Bosea sp. PAMC 26642]
MDLSSRYMGLALKNPVVASSSPLTGTLDGIRQLEDAGAAAIVLPSLFQEEIEAEDSRHDRLTGAHDESWPEASTNFPALPESARGPHRYLELVRRASEMTAVPLIASLNGVTDEGWTDYARSIEQAGAQGLELNVYFIPTDITLDGRAVEQRYLDVLRAVRAAVTIPVAVKLSPYFSAIGNLALELERDGANALVLFNRFYQPDLDIVALKVLTDLHLSEPNEIRLPLLWLAVLAGRVKLSLAAATGVTTADEVVKYVLAGADVVMTTSALLRHGPGQIGVLIDGLAQWLDARDFVSVDAARGIMSQQKLHEPKAFERANYIKILQGYGH